MKSIVTLEYVRRDGVPEVLSTDVDLLRKAVLIFDWVGDQTVRIEVGPAWDAIKQLWTEGQWKCPEWARQVCAHLPGNSPTYAVKVFCEKFTQALLE